MRGITGMKAVRNVTIQIPLFNETDALRFSKFYFDSIGESVRYVMDAQCSDRTKAIVRELDIEEVYFPNDKPFIENGYEAFAAAAPTDWIFRIDCDELPTPEALTFARTSEIPPDTVVSFERHQVIWDEGRFISPVHESFNPLDQRQFRLFNRALASFDRNIHTPGIHIGTSVHAPSGATLFHLSWIFLSWEDRIAKADRYDAHGQPAYNRANQLFSLDHKVWNEAPPSVVQDVYFDWIRREKQSSPPSIW